VTLFWIGAILILAASIAALVWPLARERAQRGVALAVAVAVVAASVLLYREWSNWDRTQAAEAAEQSAMLGSLARRLERNPEDVEGWLMLGRSQLAIGQYPLAQRAFRRADRLEDGRNPEALLGMAEAMVLQADGEVDDRSGRLFEMALELAPRSEKALFFSAVAAQKRGETALAIQRFETMLAMSPPPEVRGILEQQIASLKGAPPPVDPASPIAGSTPVAAGGTDNAATGVARVQVEVSASKAMQQRIQNGGVLFVFVRVPGQPGPPLAVKRVSVDLPVTLELTARDSMVPGLEIQAGQAVEVSAKWSKDGVATPRAGDPIGSIAYAVGRDGLKSLVINELSR
jgi:cytochrome c-type biogenesis protein CcmH